MSEDRERLIKQAAKIMTDADCASPEFPFRDKNRAEALVQAGWRPPPTGDVIEQVARLIHRRDPEAMFARFEDEGPRYLEVAQICCRCWPAPCSRMLGLRRRDEDPARSGRVIPPGHHPRAGEAMSEAKTRPTTGECQVCGREKRLRKDGTLWFHLNRSGGTWCTGAGKWPEGHPEALSSEAP